ncbi:hypothetical protein [Burkholderia cepacia]|uniref:hypothetical protein n=1 Tax=Burkholderia cepacia TaxID=292 RepID=UPI001CF17B0E|nr:hypothetical protein [Burkholderia cepacia]MCA8135684.1 hypothetical protein [Burkholderia cepacia]
MKKPASKTPIRNALIKDSSLLTSVSNGLDAVETTHRSLFDSTVRSAFADSLNLDEATKQGREQENRWDYLVGHLPSGEVVAVEPHSAKHDEISTVIRKRTAARDHLKEHLRDGAKVQKWLWVTSGKVHFADTEKARRLLDQHGIEFVGTKILPKHLPSASAPPPAKMVRRNRKG